MGTLNYGPSVSIPIDDRTLAHLQMVLVAKLRRQESFAFHWTGNGLGSAPRGMIWISPTSQLSLQFDGDQQHSINREWVEQLMQLSHTAAGLRVLPEPETQTQTRD